MTANLKSCHLGNWKEIVIASFQCVSRNKTETEYEEKKQNMIVPEHVQAVEYVSPVPRDISIWDYINRVNMDIIAVMQQTISK